MPKASEPAVACSNKRRRCFCQCLRTVRLLCGCLDLQQTPLPAVFVTEDFLKISARLSWGTQWPQGHLCALLPWPHPSPPGERLFGYVRSLPRLKRNGVLHILVRSCGLCVQLSSREEKRTLLSSVNCFFVTEYTSKTL